jgi:hypothetical protein
MADSLRNVASDLSYEVFQFRREHPELESGRLDSTNQRLRTIPCVFDAYAADRDPIPDSFQGEVERQRLMARRG